MRIYRCKCGSYEFFGSIGPFRCQGCEECGTQAGRDEPPEPHQFVTKYDQNTGKPYQLCRICMHRSTGPDGTPNVIRGPDTVVWADVGANIVFETELRPGTTATTGTEVRSNLFRFEPTDPTVIKLLDKDDFLKRVFQLLKACMEMFFTTRIRDYWDEEDESIVLAAPTNLPFDKAYTRVTACRETARLLLEQGPDEHRKAFRLEFDLTD